MPPERIVGCVQIVHFGPSRCGALLRQRGPPRLLDEVLAVGTGARYCTGMSQENVELVLEGLRHFEASDFDRATPLWHPDSRMTGPEGWPEPGPFEGRPAVIDQFKRLAAGWGDHRISDVVVEEDRECWIVVTFRWEVRGARSGAATGSNLAGAYRIEDQRIVEAHFRWTREEALEAAGLRD